MPYFVLASQRHDRCSSYQNVLNLFPLAVVYVDSLTLGSFKCKFV